MKQILILLSCLFLSQQLLAKKGEPETKALYIVPTAAELVEFSRFQVEIVKPFVDETTTSIAYIFPPELTGTIGQVVELQRIDNSLNWEGSELKASCAIMGDIFSCNIYVKPATFAANEVFNLASGELNKGLLDKHLASDYLKEQGLDQQILEKKLLVLDNFYSGDPGGILSYEFK